MRKLSLFKLLHTRKSRYIVIGLFVYCIELVVIFTAQKLGSSSVIAVALSFWIGLFVSFFLQKVFTFEDRRMHHKILIPQIVATILLVLFNFGFTVVLTQQLKNITTPAISRTLALAITSVWNFYLYKTRIFYNQDIDLID